MPTLFSSPANPPTQPQPDIPPQLRTFLASRIYQRHPLSSFMVMPANLRFETQGEQEPIVLFLRRHPITNFPWIVVAFFFLIAPIVVFPLLLSSEVVGIVTSISPGLPIIFAALWYLATFGFILSNFFVWYFTVNIVTTKRVIDIDFIFLLYKEFSEALLNRIEDVTSITGGFVRSIFNYGDVFIQTAASVEKIEFDSVPRPQEVVRIVTELVQDASG